MLATLPAVAGAVFSDLGTGSTVYGDATEGWSEYGSEFGGSNSFSNAQLFTAAGSGSIAVTQIDLGVSEGVTLNTFTASIFTDNAGTLGSEVSGAFWSLASTNPLGTCCGLVSVTGITGVDLTGGQSYFMVLGPMSLTDDSATYWSFNSQGVFGLALYSEDGTTWVSRGDNTELSAFDVIGNASAPEPGTLLLLGIGLAGMVAARRRASSTLVEQIEMEKQ